jgi:hypothetical protein
MQFERRTEASAQARLLRPDSEEAKETWQGEGQKNQKTDHFEHLRGTESSILTWANVATAAAIRPAAV